MTRALFMIKIHKDILFGILKHEILKLIKYYVSKMVYTTLQKILPRLTNGS
jgi:hypothetical protein